MVRAMEHGDRASFAGAVRHVVGVGALVLGVGTLPGCIFLPSPVDDDFGGEQAPEQDDCTGTVSGVVVGTIEHCTQTMVTETPSGRVTHGFVGLVGEQQITITFGFESDPPEAGTYDSTNLTDYQVAVGFLGWAASWDAKYDDAPDGNMTLHLSGGQGARLVGSVDAVCPPVLADESSGNVTVALRFPL
jgi:hypothetical protein